MKTFLYMSMVLVLVSFQSFSGISDFSLNDVWQSRFFQQLNKIKLEKAERAFHHLDNPSDSINIKNKHGDPLLLVVLKNSLVKHKNPKQLITFLLHIPGLNLNLQDKEGNTFLMYALSLYNNDSMFEDSETIGSVVRDLLKLIIESASLRASLNVNLKNNKDETIKVIAHKVQLDPNLARLIGVNIPIKKTIWSPFSYSIFNKKSAF